MISTHIINALKTTSNKTNAILSSYNFIYIFEISVLEMTNKCQWCYSFVPTSVWIIIDRWWIHDNDKKNKIDMQFNLGWLLGHSIIAVMFGKKLNQNNKKIDSAFTLSKFTFIFDRGSRWWFDGSFLIFFILKSNANSDGGILTVKLKESKIFL